ncbi:conserved hypothetical protein [Parafrankia sp. EAN1pec]|uniref:hypothetical protein n=1 Tax=Parafrankia sp. (strain EAN1pec) TaxID=298653 RepID=UPI000054101D|nr:conserved hypothetical protein [Frankia sp. EAN1pec]
MSTHRPRRIGRGEAERMLRGGPVNDGVGADPLADLLAAVAAPARDGELDGEEAAVAAFREARLTHVTQPRRKPMIKMMFAKLLTVKVAALAAGATAIGGVAVAASTGVLPIAGGGDSAAVSPTASPSAEVSVPAIHVPSAGASVSVSLLGLCHTYTAAAATDARTTLDSPNMRALVTAAGSPDKVDAFCAKALQAEIDAAATPGTTPGASASAGPDGNGVGAQVPGAGAGVGASAGPDGAGLGVHVGPSAGVGASARPGGAGVGAQVPSAGVGANVGQGGAGLGASAAPSVHR